MKARLPHPDEAGTNAQHPPPLRAPPHRADAITGCTLASCARQRWPQGTQGAHHYWPQGTPEPVRSGTSFCPRVSKITKQAVSKIAEDAVSRDLLMDLTGFVGH